MGNVVCFGEILLRLSPQLNEPWLRTHATSIYLGGAELNVATALAAWNISATYCSALPANYLGQEIINEIQRRGINPAVQLTGERIGIYYLPSGADIRNAGVIYDRAHSSFSALKPGMINWDDVLEGASWFHFTAINPALNREIIAVCHEAVDAARKKNMTISIDLNYREKLWQYDEQPKEIMHALVQKCDVVMGNIWAAQQLLGIETGVKESEGMGVEELVRAGEDSMLKLQSAYANVRSIAYTFRMPDHYFAVLRSSGETTVSKKFLVKEKIDPVGSGDCFMAGLIYGLMHGLTAKDIIDFAAAAATGKLAERGDATGNSVEHILKIVANG